MHAHRAIPGLLAGLAVALTGAPAVADEPSCHPGLGHGRPGGAPCVAPYARPSETPKYCGYYVGGGCAFPRKCDGRHPDEGTWGWDYCGASCLPIRVMLCWWHGRRSQGGGGAYATDGPEVPDIPAAIVAEKVNLRAKSRQYQQHHPGER